MVKPCINCLKEKQITEFHKRKDSKDGLTNSCKECYRVGLREWRTNNPEKVKLQNKKSNKIRYLRYPKKCADSAASWTKNNPEKVKTAKKKWQRNNPQTRADIQNRRRANKIGATPKWSDLTAIKQIYMNCPKGYHVDHIVPLQGKNVCGLHVPYNLQYLTASENIKKSNTFKGIGA